MCAAPDAKWCACRTPSALQALAGIRPTTGLVSRKGIVPLDNYRDTGGPMGRTVYDIALAMNSLTGACLPPSRRGLLLRCLCIPCMA